MLHLEVAQSFSTIESYWVWMPVHLQLSKWTECMEGYLAGSPNVWIFWGVSGRGWFFRFTNFFLGGLCSCFGEHIQGLICRPDELTVKGTIVGQFKEPKEIF